MEEEKPGAPPTEPIKPKEHPTNVLKFSFFDLNLDGAFSIDENKYLRFFINRGKDSFFIECLKEDYFIFFDMFTDMYEEAQDNESCTCDEVVLQTENYEEVDELNIIINAVDANTNEEVKIDETYKVYLVFNLYENFKLGIHDNHNLENTEKD